MGLDSDRIESAIRLSWGNKKFDNSLFTKVLDAAEKLR